MYAGRLARNRRGVYRFVHFPASDHEELAVVWLWSDALHGLSDVLPGQIHLTLPAEWRRRRFRVPEGVVLHHAGVPPEDRVWFGPVPVTSPRRTLRDCATEAVSPELLRQAARQAIRRGLVVNGELPEVEKALRPFGGLAT
jgi:predicted transcriptional regulator of viral defense system